MESNYRYQSNMISSSDGMIAVMLFHCLQAAEGIKAKFVESPIHDEYARLHLEALKRIMLRSEEDRDFIN